MAVQHLPTYQLGALKLFPFANGLAKRSAVKGQGLLTTVDKSPRWKCMRAATTADVDQTPHIENLDARCYDSPYHGKSAVIVGAGPAGTVCALLLAKQGFNVQVFEKRPHPDDSVSINHRSIPITLNPNVTKAMCELGLTIQGSGFMDGLHKAGPSGFISEKGLRSSGVVAGDCIIGERHAIAFSLIKTAEKKGLKHLNFVFNSSCKGLDAERKEIQFESPRGLSTVPYDLLVGADGVNSIVRQALELNIDGFSVDKIPVPGQYISFKNLPPLDDASGPFGEGIVPGRLAFMPTRGENFGGKAAPDSLLFYVTDTMQINGLVLGSDEKFDTIKDNELEWLNQVCPSTFPVAWKQPIAEQVNSGSVSAIGPILETSTLIGPSIALVGDAAHCLTPSFGFGANLAISDSIALCRAMERACGDVDAGLRLFNDDWYPHIQSTMKLEKMNIQPKNGQISLWKKFWGRYFRFHVIGHVIGHSYAPWLIPQSVYRRHFCSEITAPQAVRQFKLEAALVMAILTAALAKIVVTAIRFLRVIV